MKQLKFNAALTGAVAIFIVSFVSLAWFGRDIRSIDPDQTFHIFVSKTMVEQGSTVITIPQLPDLGWDKHFWETSYLFHTWTAAGYWLGGENGVLALSLIANSVFLMTLILIGSRYVSPWIAMVLTLGATLAHAPFLFRMILLRPFNFAAIWLMGIAWAILTRKPRVAFAAGILLSMSYTAIMMPGAYLGIALFAGILCGVQIVPTVIAGCLGIGFGSLIYPYFPSNIYSALTTFQIMSGASSSFMKPLELTPLVSVDFFNNMLFALATSAVAAFVIEKRFQIISRFQVKSQVGAPPPPPYCKSTDPSIRQENFELVTLFLWFGFMVLAFSRAQRAIEYLVPHTLLLAFAVLRYGKFTPKAQKIFCLLPLVLVFPLSLSGHKTIFLSPPVKTNGLVRDAVNLIPKNEAGAKVFSCDWSQTAYMLAARPDLKYLDLGDPVALMVYNRDLYDLRVNLVQGKVLDAFTAIRKEFKADYVVCDDINLISQLLGNPHFKVLTSAEFRASHEGLVVFQVAKEPLSEFAQSYKFTFSRPSSEVALTPESRQLHDSVNAEPLIWSVNWSTNSSESSADSARLLLANPAELLRDRAKSLGIPGPDMLGFRDLPCLQVVPTGKWETDLNQLDWYLGISGAVAVKVKAGDTMLFESTKVKVETGILRWLVKVPAHFRPQDLSVSLCDAAANGGPGISLSVWSASRLREVCQLHNLTLYPDQVSKERSKTSAEYTDLDPMGCQAQTAFLSGSTNQVKQVK